MIFHSTRRSTDSICACFIAFVVALVPASSSLAADVDCLATDSALAYWQPIKAQAADAVQPVDALAAELTSCLASPNPELRDRIGYELFTYWLREEKLSDAARRALLIELSQNLASEQPLLRSFSALILAEVMRSDANKAFMTDTERQALLATATTALSNETDFRGLERDIGWVHPVAHLADLLWRFALHPATSEGQATELLSAVHTKVAPTTVAYAFNEGDRLARVVATLINRDLLGPSSAGEWITAFQSPQSMEKWSEAFQSPAGMAELHNTKQFLRALSDQLAGADINPQIAEPLDALVKGFTQLI